MWDKPPCSRMTITRFAAADPSAALLVSTASNCGNDIPRIPAVPVVSSFRRVHSESIDLKLGIRIRLRIGYVS